MYQNPNFQFLFSHIAPYTFFVYLAHTHVLRVIDYLLWEVTIFDMVNRIILVVGGSYFLAWSIQWLLEDFPTLRFYFGLPKKPTMNWSAVPGVSRFKIKRQNHTVRTRSFPLSESIGQDRIMEMSNDPSSF
jgi:hypothetical protein